jgi:hypothetical protein
MRIENDLNLAAVISSLVGDVFDITQEAPNMEAR